MDAMTRRKFHQTAAASAVTGGGLSALSQPLTAAAKERVVGANERVRVGFIGLGNRGDQVLDAFLSHRDCEVVAICDLWQPYLDFASQKIGGGPKQYRDYRALLDRNDVDAVVIATPDHWHALQMIATCAAGKDAYVEKPLSLCVAEGRAMVAAAKRHDRVVQVGIQRLSSSLTKQVADLIQGGAIGHVTVARAFHIQNEWPLGIGNPPDTAPPADFDWEAWQGPAPAKPYNKNRTFYRFRWFYNYSGGQLTNFGVHYLASVHAALGVSAPRAVTAIGGRFAGYDNREVPDTLEVLWSYPGDTLVTFSQYNASAAPASARRCEIEFRGTKGTLYLDSNGFEIVPEVIMANEFAARTPVQRAIERGYTQGSKPVIEPRRVAGDMSDAPHARNFLDCVKSRQQPNCDLEFAHRATSSTLIAGIAHRTKSLLEWDPDAERFTNNDAANSLLRYDYRPPHKFPT